MSETVSGTAGSPEGPYGLYSETGTATAEPDTLPTARVEAFSDAVIAVAATLLVLEIKAPEPGDDVWPFLASQVPSLAAYAVSFLTILIFWVNHHALFHAAQRVSRVMLFVNGLLLLAISFISYATGVLSHALQSGHDDRAAAVLYAGTLGAASLCFTGLWLCLDQRPQLLTPVARDQRKLALRRSFSGPALYAVAAVVALISAPASLAIDAAVAVFFATRTVAQKGRTQ